MSASDKWKEIHQGGRTRSDRLLFLTQQPGKASLRTVLWVRGGGAMLVSFSFHRQGNWVSRDHQPAQEHAVLQDRDPSVSCTGPHYSRAQSSGWGLWESQASLNQLTPPWVPHTLNAHKHSVRKLLLLLPFYRQGNWGSGRLSHCWGYKYSDSKSMFSF